MENLTRDALFMIAIKLDLPSLLNFCSSHSRINNLIYKRDNIWQYKLDKEFKNELPDFVSLNKNSRDLYNLLYSLKILKEFFKLNVTLKELFNRKKLDLNYKNLTKIPKELFIYS